MIFLLIEEYMKRSKVDRQQHLKLDESCIEIGGASGDFRALLAHYLKTTIPRGHKIHLCHACNNGKCSNPKHLYWGFVKENMADSEVNKLGGIASTSKRYADVA